MNSIGSVEFRSICKGIEVANEMIKRNNVDVTYAKSICPGKFIIIFSGDAAEVEEAVNLGNELGKQFLVDYFIINNVHEQIVHALKNKYDSKDCGNKALGIMETTKVCVGIKALDKALKSGDVNLIKLQLAFAVGGKFVFILSGTVSDIEYSINEAIKKIDSKSIIATSIIPSPAKELIDKII